MAAAARVIVQAQASSVVLEVAAALFKGSVAEAAPRAAPASAAAPAGEALVEEVEVVVLVVVAAGRVAEAEAVVGDGSA